MAVEPDRPRLILPGLIPPDPFLETYLVKPGGATVFPLGADDRMTVIDRDGGQQAEVTVLAEDGREDYDAVGASDGRAPATVLRSALRSPTGNGFVGDLHARGLNPEEASAVRLFGEWSPPGTSQSFLAERPVTVVVAAPGGRIVDGAPPPSDLLVEVRRTAPRGYGELELPAPLAEPRLDLRVEKATALAYEVRAGEYIQVIDVEGRQCSDFLAFHRAKLEDGVERGLDATVTRTLMGNAYPTPGLQGKFYDADMVPLVEVVRDTVGRHDTFALACTAKYYEDMGYPGHTNCTDNFNRELDPYAIAARKGWPALNFFYNTAFDSSLLLTLDEPWSRPGDYVLLRALTDLVCSVLGLPRRHRPRERLEHHRRPRARLPGREHVLGRDRAPGDAGRRAGADEGDDLPPAHPGADEELRRVPRLLAAALLQQRGRDRRVLGLPRARGRDGPLAAAQVGDPRAGRRGARPVGDHARRAPARGRARSSTPRSATRPAG